MWGCSAVGYMQPVHPFPGYWLGTEQWLLSESIATLLVAPFSVAALAFGYWFMKKDTLAGMAQGGMAFLLSFMALSFAFGLWWTRFVNSAYGI